ncbi:MAG: acyl-CoA carboxylase subunit epsilon [Frankiaceae bacterium]|nr:acyl-CoA carboxylase subunit epsilon [Frankiaceae bacterium]MBV9869163.1 acyl-CoA carboxylase subunit epsilon [Frankiaceae bacterium]
MAGDETTAPPVLRVIKGGEPSDEELAALVAVLSARGGEPAPERRLREPLSPWVASGLVKGTRTKA